MSSAFHRPSFPLSFLLFVSILSLISTGLALWSISLHVLLLMSLFIASTAAWSLQRQGFPPIREAMQQGISRALPAISIFILIGVLIAALIQSGTVATLIVYGIALIDPAWFLPGGLLLCSLMSLATGTSWGTVGTAGIVLMGIGSALQFPAPLVAGMIVSGACFGDKMSPVSDTTNLAAMAAETPLYRHIRSMLCTTGPCYLLCLLVFTWLGQQHTQAPLPTALLQNLLDALHGLYQISLWTLLPLILMFGLIALRVTAEPALLCSALLAVAIALGVQQQPVPDVLNALYAGGSAQTGIATLDNLLSRGGIAAMMWTLSLALLALALGGILQHFGFLQVLIQGVIGLLQLAANLVCSTLVIALSGNLLMGEAYLSILLGGTLLKDKYDQLGVDRAILSRSLEEGATLTTALIPWTTGGAFFAATLGVDVLSYAPWALLNWLNPLLSAGFAYAGIALWRNHSTTLAQAKSVDHQPSRST